MLLKAILSGNNSTFDFVRKSRCGPINEDQQHPRVCCGKYGGEYEENVGGAMVNIRIRFCLLAVEFGDSEKLLFRKFLVNQFVFVAFDLCKDYEKSFK